MATTNVEKYASGTGERNIKIVGVDFFTRKFVVVLICKKICSGDLFVRKYEVLTYL